MKFLLHFIFLLADPSLALGPAGEDYLDDGGSPMLFFFLLTALAIVLILIGMGIVLGVAVVASAITLAGLGIISTAALMGLMKKRFSSGFRALHYQVCALLALPCGIGAVWFGRMLCHWGLSNATVMLSGTLIGISAGLGLAFIFDRVVVVAHRKWIEPRLKISS
ncbi:hypothetical protein OAG53_00405 [Akkermansiaceae bacterium]|nr:hypothetical protein [Akkermansiaceae bacterium]